VSTFFFLGFTFAGMYVKGIIDKRNYSDKKMTEDLEEKQLT